MKNAFYWVFFISLIIIALILSIDVVFSQTPPPPPSKPVQNPIDGGLILLAGAGGAYAIHKLRDKEQ